MVKKPDCVYQTNSRGADWVKVKPECVWLHKPRLLDVAGLVVDFTDIRTRWERIWIYLCSGAGGEKVDVRARYRSCCAVFESRNGMMDQAKPPSGLQRPFGMYRQSAHRDTQVYDFHEDRVRNELRGLRVDPVRSFPSRSLCH